MREGRVKEYYVKHNNMKSSPRIWCPTRLYCLYYISNMKEQYRTSWIDKILGNSEPWNQLYKKLYRIFFKGQDKLLHIKCGTPSKCFWLPSTKLRKAYLNTGWSHLIAVCRIIGQRKVKRMLRSPLTPEYYREDRKGKKNQEERKLEKEVKGEQ